MLLNNYFTILFIERKVKSQQEFVVKFPQLNCIYGIRGGFGEIALPKFRQMPANFKSSLSSYPV